MAKLVFNSLNNYKTMRDITEIVNILNTKGITAYRLSKDLLITEPGARKILEGKSDKPRRTTLKMLDDYINRDFEPNEDKILQNKHETNNLNVNVSLNKHIKVGEVEVHITDFMVTLAEYMESDLFLNDPIFKSIMEGLKKDVKIELLQDIIAEQNRREGK